MAPPQHPDLECCISHWRVISERKHKYWFNNLFVKLNPCVYLEPDSKELIAKQNIVVIHFHWHNSSYNNISIFFSYMYNTIYFFSTDKNTHQYFPFLYMILNNNIFLYLELPISSWKYSAQDKTMKRHTKQIFYNEYWYGWYGIFFYLRHKTVFILHQFKIITNNISTSVFIDIPMYCHFNKWWEGW